MDWTLEVVILPVSDIDAAIAFYRDKVGFDLDHDTRTDQVHIAQLTPRWSGCSATASRVGVRPLLGRSVQSAILGRSMHW